jgi:hypothetical protein
MTRPDLSALAVGLTIVVLGVLLLLQEKGSIDLDGGWLLAGVTASAGGALLASGLGAREP